MMILGYCLNYDSYDLNDYYDFDKDVLLFNSVFKSAVISKICVISVQRKIIEHGFTQIKHCLNYDSYDLNDYFDYYDFDKDVLLLNSVFKSAVISKICVISVQRKKNRTRIYTN